MIDSLGDVGAALADARPESLSQLYRILVSSFAMNHKTEPLSHRHHHVWLAHVSEGGPDP
jgi:hypothetical protein